MKNQSIKPTIFITLFCLITFFLNFSIFGEVKFNFHFDPIFDTPENLWMKEEANEVADFLGSVIEQNAELNIRISAISSNAEEFYATAGFDAITFPLHQGLELAHPPAHLRIITFNKSDDGYIIINLSYVKKQPTFFQRAILHELTHILGFEAIARMFDDENPIINGFLPFDKFIRDQNGEPFIIKENEITKINSMFNLNGYIYACGENIKKRTGGCIRLFNKRHFPNLDTNSFIHLDPNIYEGNIMNPSTRLVTYKFWNRVEIGVMEDLGFKINFEKFCKIYAKLHLENHEYQSINVKTNGFPDDVLSLQLVKIKEYELAPKECKNSNVFYKGDLLLISRVEDDELLITVEIGADGYTEDYIKDIFYRIVFEVVQRNEAKLEYDLHGIKVENPKSNSCVFN